MQPAETDPVEHGERSADTTRPTTRGEGFSDGVFAIAITLLTVTLVEIEDEQPLAERLREQWPVFVAYAFSWTVIGIYWLQHHFTFKVIARSDHLTNVYNLLLLMMIALLPWSTSIIGTAIAEDRDVRLAAIVYIGSLGLPAVAWNLFFAHVRRAGLFDPLLKPEYVPRLARFYLIGMITYGVALALAFVEPLVGLAAAALGTLAYLRPPPAPAYTTEAEHEARATPAARATTM